VDSLEQLLLHYYPNACLVLPTGGAIITEIFIWLPQKIILTPLQPDFYRNHRNLGVTHSITNQGGFISSLFFLFSLFFYFPSYHFFSSFSLVSDSFLQLFSIRCLDRY
jgi:hypothetical protein